MLQLLQESQLPEILVALQDALVLSPVETQLVGGRGSVNVSLNVPFVERRPYHHPALKTAQFRLESALVQVKQRPCAQHSL